MGREIKRVAADFEWPIDKVWKGYKNPWYEFSYTCPSCDGSGYGVVAKIFHDEWYGYEEFDPVAYGSKLITPETPALKQFVEYQVDRSIREAATGTAFKMVDRRVTYTGTDCFYTDNGKLTREQAILRESHRLMDLWNNCWSHHLIQADVDALLKKDRLQEFTHRPLPGIPLEQYVRTHAYYLWVNSGRPCSDGVEFWLESEKLHGNGYRLPYPNGRIPTVEEVNASAILSSFGVTGESYTCIEARCEREGYSVLCPECLGKGSCWHPTDAEQKAEQWKPEEPPAGEAYQIWETVSEGSPISPAFTNPKILAEYMANSPPWGAAEPMSAEQWLKWIVGPGWAPSAVITNGVYQDGVAAICEIGDSNE
jgi:hypothetical protein